MSGLSYAGLHHVKFPVTDLDASLKWYEKVLKAKREPRFRPPKLRRQPLRGYHVLAGARRALRTTIRA